jgi:hypothetical protein
MVAVLVARVLMGLLLDFVLILHLGTRAAVLVVDYRLGFHNLQALF